MADYATERRTPSQVAKDACLSWLLGVLEGSEYQSMSKKERAATDKLVERMRKKLEWRK